MLDRLHRSSGVHRAGPEGYDISAENRHDVSLGTCLCIPVQRGMESKASNANSCDSEVRQRIPRPTNETLISDLNSFLWSHKASARR